MTDDGSFLVIAGDVFERFTNGAVAAVPHRVLATPWARNALIRFNAVSPDTVVAPIAAFVDAAAGRPAAYGPVTMRRHMEVTMENLKQGKGSWLPGDPGRSLTATYDYSYSGTLAGGKGVDCETTT